MLRKGATYNEPIFFSIQSVANSFSLLDYALCTFLSSVVILLISSLIHCLFVLSLHPIWRCPNDRNLRYSLLLIYLLLPSDPVKGMPLRWRERGTLHCVSLRIWIIYISVDSRRGLEYLHIQTRHVSNCK